MPITNTLRQYAVQVEYQTQTAAGLFRWTGPAASDAHAIDLAQRACTRKRRVTIIVGGTVEAV